MARHRPLRRRSDGHPGESPIHAHHGSGAERGAERGRLERDPGAPHPRAGGMQDSFGAAGSGGYGEGDGNDNGNAGGIGDGNDGGNGNASGNGDGNAGGIGDGDGNDGNGDGPSGHDPRGGGCVQRGEDSA